MEARTWPWLRSLTRVAAGMHTSPADGHVVFDKIGDAYTLAEIWIPGQDGYILAVTKAKHEHRIINVKYLDSRGPGARGKQRGGAPGPRNFDELNLEPVPFEDRTSHPQARTFFRIGLASLLFL